METPIKTFIIKTVLLVTSLFTITVTPATAGTIPSLWIGNDLSTTLPVLNTDLSGHVLRTIAAPIPVSGIAIGNNILYMGGIYAPITSRPLDTLSPVTSLPNVPAVDFQEDMAFDGTYLWRIGAHVLEKIDPNTGSLIASVPFTLPSGEPTWGLAWDGSNFWISSAVPGGMIRQITSAGVFTGNEFPVASSFSPAGLAYDPTDNTLFIGTDGGAVHHYSLTGTELPGGFTLSDGRRVDGLEFQAYTCLPEPLVLFNTGMDSNHMVLANGAVDQHYVLTTNPNGGGSNALVVVGNGLTNTTNSAWIGNGNGASGTYVYQMTFNLPCTNNVIILGQWAVDNNGAILLNGNPTPVATLTGGGSGNFTTWHPFTITTGLVAGQNTLDFSVTNVGAGPTGLRVELSGTATCCCPPTNTVILNTGYDHANGMAYQTGTADAFWKVVADPNPGTFKARPAIAITPNPAWAAPELISQWISSYNVADDDLNGPYDFQTQFCLESNYTNIVLHICLRADDWAEVFLNGDPNKGVNKILQAGDATHSVFYAHPRTDPFCVTVLGPFQAGPNYLLVRVHNQYNVAMGLNLTGTVTGSGLMLDPPECCQPLSGISGQKFYDLNNNGVRDPGEPALPGWTVHLSNGANAVTDVNGYYYFTNLVPGTYTVTEVARSDWTQTAPAGGSITVTLGVAQEMNSRDFGNWHTNDPTCIRIFCPGDLTNECTGFGAIVSYAVTATNLCSTNPPRIYCTPASTSLFPVGTTTVHCTAYDTNTGNYATCSFNVTVVDTTPPVLICANDKMVNCSSNWTFDPPTAVDACCGTNVTITSLMTMTNGTCPQFITRTWRATDCWSNSVTCSQTVTIVSCVPPPSGMTLWLPFDETSGTTSANLYAGGNNGTQINGPGVNLGGYVANSLCFNGVNQSVSVPDYTAINPGTGDLSIDAWVKRDPASGNTVRVIVDKRDPNTGVGYSLAVSFGNLVFQLGDSSGFTNYRDTGTVPADNQWHLIAVTVNRNSTTGGKFYIGGLPTGTFDPTGEPGSLNNTSPFEVARSPLGGNSPWLGCIDEVEFFTRALAPSEILGIYNAGPAGKCKSPVLVCATNKVVQCDADWSFNPPTVTDPCNGANVTPVILSTVTNGVGHITFTGGGSAANGEVVFVSNTATSGFLAVTAGTNMGTYTLSPGGGSNANFFWDGLIFPTSDPFVDDSGLLFTGGGVEINLYGNGPGSYSLVGAPTNNPNYAPLVTNGVATITVYSQMITRTWLFTDACGNTNACSQTVTVVDTTPPVITTCAPNQTVTACNTTIPDFRPQVVAHDNCAQQSDLTITQTPAPGSAVGPGIYPIGLKVCDPAGNCAQCVATFTVLPIETPAARQVWNTGVGANGAPLPSGTPDPHFTLVSRPQIPPSSLNTALAVGSHAAWNVPGTASSWIGTSTSWNDDVGDYVYQTYITNYCDQNQMVLEGRWAADDAVQLFIDGQFETASTAPSYTGWQNFIVTPTLTTGSHIAQFVVNNYPFGANPTGLRVEWTNYCGGCPINTAPCLPPYIITQPQSVTLVDATAPSIANPAVFTVLAGGTPTLDYQWCRNNVPLSDGPKVSGSKTPTLTIKGNLGSGLGFDPGPYTVKITNSCSQITITSSAAKIYYLLIVYPSTPGSGLVIDFSSDPGVIYDVNYRNDLAPTTPWQLLESVVGTGTNNIVVDPNPNPVMRFYQIVPQTGP
jgi:hypothetical protein